MEGVERWLPVAGHAGYFVSDRGRVVNHAGKSMALHTCPNGYLRFRAVSDSGIRSTLKIHREVLRSFSGITGSEVRHLDGCKTNNHLQNLTWGTRRENGIDMLLHGTNRTAKLSRQAVLNAKIMKSLGAQTNQIAAWFGVHKKTMSKALRGVTWSHLSWDGASWRA